MITIKLAMIRLLIMVRLQTNVITIKLLIMVRLQDLERKIGGIKQHWNVDLALVEARLGVQPEINEKTERGSQQGTVDAKQLKVGVINIWATVDAKQLKVGVINIRAKARLQNGEQQQRDLGTQGMVAEDTQR